MFKNNMVRYAIEALVIAAVIIAVILCVKFSNFKNINICIFLLKFEEKSVIID